MAHGSGQGHGIGKHPSQIAVGLQFEDLGADMGVEPGEACPAAADQVPQHRFKLVGVKAKFAIEVPGADVLVGVALDPRRKAEHQLHGRCQARRQFGQ